MRTRFLALLIVLALVLAACTDGGEAGDTTTTTTAGTSTTETAPPDESTTTTTVGTTTTTGALELPPGTENLPEETRLEIAELIATTERVRGLEFLEPVTITVLADEAYQQRARELVLEDTEDLPADQALYRLLGLLGEEEDLLQIYSDLVGGGTAGFYDPEAGEMVIRSTDGELSPSARATLVHELTHALQDQQLGLQEIWEGLLEAEAFDEFSAFQALVEGDATLAEVAYLQELPNDELLAILEDAQLFDTGVFDNAPPFLQESLFFPYTTGLAFTQTLFVEDGWQGVNGAYDDRPLSTEQIIDPPAYGRDAPVEVALPEIADPAGYDRVYESTWGQLGFELMFGQVLGDATAETAGDGWGGDAYVQWFDGQNAALVLRFVGDTASDAQEMADALREYVVAGMTAGDGVETDGGTVFERLTYAFVAERPDGVWFVAAGDPAVGADLTSQILAAGS